MKVNHLQKRPWALLGFLCVALALIGLFHEYLSCLASVFLLAYLGFRVKQEGKLSTFGGLGFYALSVLILFYALSFIWAESAGMAFIGFLKYLPVLLFYLCLRSSEERAFLRSSLPYAAAALTVLSAVLSFLPVVGEEFLVNERFGGFFQYPNAFAAFLMVSELELVTKEKFRLWDWLCLPVLLAGFLYTGSRTAFVIALLANAFIFLFTKGKKIRLCFFGFIGLAAVGLICYGAFFDSFGIFSRLLNISFKESTFVGRLLYYRDALPVILKNPLGLGYMGYYYTQSSFQTGVYSVMFVHNDWLQIFLDVGWIPAVMMAAAVGKSLFSRGGSVQTRVILASLTLHLLFDFDLSFIAMFCILVLYLPVGEKEIVPVKGKVAALSVLGVLLALCIYMAAALGLARFSQNRLSHLLYPWNTQNQIELLSQIEDVEEAAAFGEEILSQCDSVLLGHCARARLYYSQGDFANLIACKKEILNLAPFQYDEYEEFAYMLVNGINLYSEVGDTYSVKVCRDELLLLKDGLERLPERLSPLGRLIKDQPETAFPEELAIYVEELGGAS